MRTPEQRARHKRQLTLLSSGEHNLDEQTRAALTEVWTDGDQPDHIRLRPGLVVRDSSLPGPLSDRDPPPPISEKTALARLVRSRGIALQFELIALFLAQCRGGRAAVEAMSIDPADGLGWRHLVLGPVTAARATTTAATVKDNRVRQIRSALTTLADPTVGLIHLPHAAESSRRFEQPQLLSEVGTRPTGEAARYKSPPASASTIDIPVNFFLNGWVHVLGGAEIAAWLMFRHRTHALTYATLDGQDRLARYTQRLPTWRQHTQLSAYGLLDVQADPNRRPDGTIEDRPARGEGMLHRFAMTDDGLDANALDTVLATL